MGDFSCPVDARGSAEGFVGVAQLKKEHAVQLEKFQWWAATETWRWFHSSHYDWWAFPIDQRSSRGTKYVVSPADAQRIADDPDFIHAIREGVRLLMLSWGWDVATRRPVPTPNAHAGQAWTGYAVRLWKAGRCMQVLRQDDYFASLLAFAQHQERVKGRRTLAFSSTHARGDCVELWEKYARERAL